MSKNLKHMRYINHILGRGIRNDLDGTINWYQFLELRDNNRIIDRISTNKTVSCPSHINDESCTYTCKECVLKITYPRIKYSELENYEIIHVPILFTFTYYVESIVNGFPRNFDIERILIDKMVKEYNFDKEYLINLIENKDILKDFFVNEEKIEIISLYELGY